MNKCNLSWQPKLKGTKRLRSCICLQGKLNWSIRKIPLSKLETPNGKPSFMTAAPVNVAAAAAAVAVEQLSGCGPALGAPGALYLLSAPRLQ